MLKPTIKTQPITKYNIDTDKYMSIQPQQPPQKNKKSNQKQSKHQKSKQQKSMFLATSRLNRGQRKYCNCLMQVRTQKKIKPYAICKNMSYKIMRATHGQPAFRFNPHNTNCVMNYDYSQYTLSDVQALARESGIPTHNPKTGRINNKSTLVQLLTSRYISNHRSAKKQS